ncbi:MAG: hypothetical protein CSB44_11625 [Gammaproteobacteria bacterium]|nr:MAG: hypothetical protein CSB44_11625 [Gammaproteobacteria bacterium]
MSAKADTVHADTMVADRPRADSTDSDGNRTDMVRSDRAGPVAGRTDREEHHDTHATGRKRRDPRRAGRKPYDIHGAETQARLAPRQDASARGLAAPLVLAAFFGLALLVCLVNLLIVSTALRRQGLDLGATANVFAHNAELAWRWSQLGIAAALATLVSLLWLWRCWSRNEHERRLRKRRTEQSEQAAIVTLLDEMSPLAQGDLGARATVGNARTATVADAFNHAVDEIRWLVSTIDSSATAVSASASRSHGLARSMSRACNVQAREIHRSSNYITAMSGAMTELAALAAASSRKSQRVTTAAQEGRRALTRSLESLDGAQDAAEDTLLLMNRLAENTDSIEARAETVREVTRRTDLLALNSTIQVVAASSQEEFGAGAPDDGLSRLAAEVQELASILATATREIDALTRSIADDIAATVEAMRHTRSVLATGTADTEAAGRQLDGIGRLSQDLQQHVVDIAARTVRQSGVVRKLSDNMSLINDLTRQTAAEVRGNADELDELHALASDLRAGVAEFRLGDPRESKHV